MTRTFLILLATAGSVGLLAGAFLFQALGWAPCTMCIWQRWPHVAAAVIGGFGLAVAAPFVALAGALSMGVSTALAIYHSGVERKWWEGPSSCTSGGDGLSGLSGADLLPGAAEAPALVMCDALEPFLFGLTMANWNVLASVGLLGVWGMAALRKA